MELFRPNNLSRNRPAFVAVEDETLRAEVKELLGSCYGLSGLQEMTIARFAGANISSQNFKVSCGAASWFLKSRELSQFQQMQAELALNQDLADLGQPVPQIMRSVSGTSLTTDGKKCWALYKFQCGDYFSGTRAQLKAAASSYGKLAAAAWSLPIFIDGAHEADEFAFLNDLEGIVREISIAQGSDAVLVDLCSSHKPSILAALEVVRRHESLLRSKSLPLHLDYHPLNLLMKDDEVVCILDLEHLRCYPVVAGVGFAAYKLIRQAMVEPEFRTQELRSHSAPGLWNEAWKEWFPDSTFTAADLGIGARFRILKIIHLILDASLRRSDHRSSYDLPKHIYSLNEVEVIFDQ